MSGGLAVALAGRRNALADSGGFALAVELIVPPTGVTALCGPSGAGKTSVLRAVAGLDRYAGTVRFGDELWQADRCFVPPHRRRIGYVAQGGGLLPHLTVAGNLAYAARRAPAGRFTHDHIVAATGTTGLLGRYPASLSGGEGQRAAIARALLGQPRLLLLDEPLAGIDSAGRDALLETLAALFAAAAMPVIYVTHDASEAARLATTTLRLRHGRIEHSAI